MFNFWKKKSYFNTSFYDSKPSQPLRLDSRKEELKIEVEKPKEEKKNVTVEKLIRRGSKEPLAERLTNRRFGLNMWLNEVTDEGSLTSDSMMVAVLMDIRERLDKLIELNTKPNKEKCTHKWGPTNTTGVLQCFKCQLMKTVKPTKK